MTTWHALKRREAGSLAMLMIAAIAITAACCLGVARVGDAAADRARADAAADAAALAAADTLARGGSAGEAALAARQVAGENGATFVVCVCTDTSATVTVAQGAAQGRARAVVDP